VARKRSRLSDERHVDVIPLGQVDALVVSIVAANLQTVIGLNADALPPLPDPEYAYLPQRGQYTAGKILLALESLTGGARFRLGVAQFDICTPILGFVYGESQLGGKAAVISLHRLDHPDPGQMYLRAAKIGLHETGHLLGIGHCRAANCLMNFASNLGKLDTIPLSFCSSCEFEIARSLRHCFGRS
jgi:archaemetzincin